MADIKQFYQDYKSGKIDKTRVTPSGLKAISDYEKSLKVNLVTDIKSGKVKLDSLTPSGIKTAVETVKSNPNLVSKGELDLLTKYEEQSKKQAKLNEVNRNFKKTSEQDKARIKEIKDSKPTLLDQVGRDIAYTGTNALKGASELGTNVLKLPIASVGAFGKGVDTIAEGYRRIGEAVTGKPVERGLLQKLSSGVYESSNDVLKKMGTKETTDDMRIKDTLKPSYLGEQFGNAAKSLGKMPAHLATGGATILADTLGREYSTGAMEGRTLGQSTMTGVPRALVEYGTEKLPLELLGELAKNPTIKKFVVSFGADALGEIVANLGNNTIDELAYGDNKQGVIDRIANVINTTVEQTPETLLQTGLTQGMVYGGAKTYQGARQLGQNINNALNENLDNLDTPTINSLDNVENINYNKIMPKLTPQESLQPALQQEQVQTMPEQPKIDLIANKEVVEPVQQNQPHINDRTYKDVSKKSVQAYQIVNPEAKPFIRQEANRIMEELNVSQKSETIKGVAQTEQGNTVGRNYQTGRQTSDTINRILDEITPKPSYKEVEEALMRVTDYNTQQFVPKNNEYIKTKGDDPTKYDKKEQNMSFLYEDDIQTSTPKLSLAERQLMEEKANIPTTTTKMSAEDMQKYFGVKIEQAKTDIDLNNTLAEVESEIANATDEKIKLNLQFFSEQIKKKLQKRKFVSNSILNSQFVPEEVKQDIMNRPESEYEPITNKDTLDKAMERVDLDLNKAVNEYYDSKVRNADTTALAEAIAKKSFEQGNIEQGTDVLVHLAERLTEAGQEIQAARIMKKLSPEGMVMNALKTVKKANETIKQENPKLYDEMMKKKELPELSQEEIKIIYDTMKEAETLTGREKDIKIAEAMQIISNKIPPTLGQKIKGLLTMSMLLNPKTLLTRNPLGNAILSSLETITDIPTGLYDYVAGMVTGKRTSTGFDVGKVPPYFKGLAKGITELVHDWKNNVDTSPTRGQMELPRTQNMYKNKFLNEAYKLMAKTLQLGDRPFYEAAREMRLYELNKLKKQGKLDKNIDIEEDANRFALERVFQDSNEFTKAVTGVKKAINRGKDFGVADLIVPFTQTPANILKTVYEYSPAEIIGLTADLYNAKTKGTFNQESFTKKAGRMTTGTVGLIGLGYLLAQSGIITGSSEDEPDKVKNLKRDIGVMDYSFKIGDKYYTFDWAQPVSVGIAVGANMYNSGKKRGDIVSALVKGSDTIFNQSFLQGLSKLSGYGSPTAGMIASLAGSTSQPLPTVLNQTAQMTDNYVRDTSGDLGNRLKSRLPLLRQTTPIAIDRQGNEKIANEGQNVIEKAFNIYLNPSTVRKDTTNEVDKEVLRLYNVTGNTDAIPIVGRDKFTQNYQNYKLTPTEKQEFQKVMGKDVYPKLQLKINSNEYKKADEEKKVKLLKKVIDDGYKKAKENYLKLPPLKKN